MRRHWKQQIPVLWKVRLTLMSWRHSFELLLNPTKAGLAQIAAWERILSDIDLRRSDKLALWVLGSDSASPAEAG